MGTYEQSYSNKLEACEELGLSRMLAAPLLLEVFHGI